MKSAHILYHMVRADFLERVRGYSFLVTLASALYLAYAVATEKVWIVVGNGYRGAYNSAWIGILMTICCSTFLSLAGFYIVKNSVQRDTDTRVGQILAATPMRKPFYTLAKTLSNFAVLACMVGVLMLAAVVMQMMRAEGHSLNLWKLWSPFILLALPMMLLTASVAVWFETLPVLRGGFGNVIYFFAWTASLAMGATDHDDPAGLHLLYRSTRHAVEMIDPSTPQRFQFSLTIGGERAVRTFLWNGLEWNGESLSMRLLWVAVAVAIAMLAAVSFTRFDPARRWRERAAENQTKSEATPTLGDTSSASSPASVHLSPLPRNPSRSRFVPLVASELRLMLKGKRWWWYAGAVGMLVGQIVSPEAAVRSGFLLAAWIWPILLWSEMGCRELRYFTCTLVFSSEKNLSRQLPALWTAGVVIALLTGAGAGVRLLLASDWHSFLAWLAGAIFIPSLALACGIWTGASKAFEAIYTVWWYVGPGHQMPGADFMGLTPASSSPVNYALAAVLLIAAAYWRRRQSLGYA